MHKRMRWRRVTVLSAHSYAPSCFRWFLLNSNGPFDLVATFLCPVAHREKGQREQRKTKLHMLSPIKEFKSWTFLFTWLCGGISWILVWILVGYELATEEFKCCDCGDKASYQENFENHMWSQHGSVHCGDLIGKTREGSCCALSPNSPTETPPKYARNMPQSHRCMD